MCTGEHKSGPMSQPRIRPPGPRGGPAAPPQSPRPRRPGASRPPPRGAGPRSGAEAVQRQAEIPVAQAQIGRDGGAAGRIAITAVRREERAVQRRPQLGRGRSAGAGDAAPVGRRKAGRWGRLVHGGSDAGAGPGRAGRPGSGLLPLYGVPARHPMVWIQPGRCLVHGSASAGRGPDQPPLVRRRRDSVWREQDVADGGLAAGHRLRRPVGGRAGPNIVHFLLPDHAPGGRVGRAYSPSLLGHERTSRSRTGSSVERATGHRAGDRSRSSSRRTLVSGGESHAFKGSSPHCTPRS